MPLVQACAMMFCAAYLMLVLIADMCRHRLQPEAAATMNRPATRSRATALYAVTGNDAPQGSPPAGTAARVAAGGAMCCNAGQRFSVLGLLGLVIVVFWLAVAFSDRWSRRTKAAP